MRICYLVWQKNQERSVKKLIKVTSQKDISQIENEFVKNQIERLLHYLITEYSTYCTDDEISHVGAIYFVNDYTELNDFERFGMIEPIKKSHFEFIEEIGEDFSHGVIVISTDYSISIFAPTKLFNNHFKRIEK